MKSSTTNSFDLSKQSEENQLTLTTMQKETQVYSYWKDSIYYQYEVIREQIDQAKAGAVKTLENQQAKQEQTIKESQPIDVWIYAGIILGIIWFILTFKKLIL
ncbi:MAG: hypothetical protein EOO01_32325 [Chitinophagaceae bacterium]|nr:MAG: hypothetical protein EOO01_32325 [Chitinophagaceae bacterium]